ncbi:DUF4430 domain-containing protein [Aminipila luticellarii]|uniref:DUF4430 domain-containing protein n=1 Tax=Aminipila luticellarii TaxID=2507160 RepID=A0A410PU44_9FIRM|nr:DUF4430 domain-containing protein [Aminipila luticellarii]QAT42491.1 DUF4430 domain-containing protein [Aminipila luticellarii]
MKISRNKIYAAIAIVAVLVIAFCWGGGFAKGSPSSDLDNKTSVETAQKAATDGAVKADTETKSAIGTTTGAVETEKSAEAAKATASAVKVDQKAVAYSESKGMKIDKSTGKDKYQTDPVPEGKPIPVEPGTANITKTAKTCTMSIECKTILDNMDNLNKEKVELVPENGVIMPPTTVTFYEGESVFNLLQRETKKNKIHMEFVNTPIYNSAYIEGINNLYEFDCGELSGWMYKVNGWFPNYGCSRYVIKQGDVIEWIYTCDLGRDIGGGFNEQ